MVVDLPLTVKAMAVFGLPPNSSLRLAVQVFETVKRDIVTGTLAPNAQLSEADLSEHLGVSRTPVREALIKLAEDGLVKIVPQVGTFVAPISVELVKEAQFIREHLECALIVDAARWTGKETLRSLYDNLDKQRQAARNDDWVDFLTLDESLHETLASSSGHPIAWRIIQQSKTHLDRVRLLSFRMPEHMTEIIGQHARIVDAVAHGNGELAQAAMRDTFEGSAWHAGKTRPRRVRSHATRRRPASAPSVSRRPPCGAYRTVDPVWTEPFDKESSDENDRSVGMATAIR